MANLNPFFLNFGYGFNREQWHHYGEARGGPPRVTPSQGNTRIKKNYDWIYKRTPPNCREEGDVPANHLHTD